MISVFVRNFVILILLVHNPCHMVQLYIEKNQVVAKNEIPGVEGGRNAQEERPCRTQLADLLNRFFIKI